MPSLDDARNAVPVQACSASRVIADVPSNTEKVPYSGRRSREQREQVNAKTQELSKKLVKALTEKIRKRMHHKEQFPMNNTSEMETAVSSLTDVRNASIESLDKFAQSSEEPVMKSLTVEQNHESILDNLPENLPIIEAGNLDSSPLPLTTYSVTEHSQSGFHISSVSQSSPSTNILSSSVNDSMHSVTKPNTTDSAVCTTGSLPTRLQQTSAPSAHAPSQINKHHYLRQNTVPSGNQNLYRQCNTVDATNTYTGTQNSQAVYYYPDTPQTMYNMFPNPAARPPNSSNNDSEIMLQRYIQQQNSFVQDIPKHPGAMKDTYNMKSPDSGYGESTCETPKDPSHVVNCYEISHDCSKYTINLMSLLLH